MAQRVLTSDVADINEATAREVADANGWLGVKTDISSEADIEAMITATVSHFGRLDVLFNNAGIGFNATGRFRIAPLVDTAEDNWDAVIGINPKGADLAVTPINEKVATMNYEVKGKRAASSKFVRLSDHRPIVFNIH